MVECTDYGTEHDGIHFRGTLQFKGKYSPNRSQDEKLKNGPNMFEHPSNRLRQLKYA